MEKSQFQIFLRVGEKCWRYDSTRLGIAVKDEIRVNDLRETLLITIRGPPSLKFKLSFPLPPPQISNHPFPILETRSDLKTNLFKI